MSRYENDARYEYEDDDDFEAHENDHDEVGQRDNVDDHNEDHNDFSGRSAFDGSYQSSRGYQFDIANGQINAVYEFEHGSRQLEHSEFGETWSVSGSSVVKTEVEHGFTKTSIYADANGDGIFQKISQSYQSAGQTALSQSQLVLSGSNDDDDQWRGSETSDRYYGDVGDDILHGYRGHDELYGGNDNDHLYGEEGNDRLYGSSGDDYLDGGDGIDHAYFEGASSQYNLTRSATEIFVRDTLNVRDGLDTVANVERLHFTDHTVAFDIEGDAGQAFRLYQAALDRTPDDHGLASWINYMDNGAQLNMVSQKFIDSQEFGAKYGALDDDDFVNQLYLNVLDRDGEAGGIKAWVGALSRGVLTRADVLVGFSESAENKANVIGQIENGILYSEWWL